jgi:hypothetical protein
MRGELCGSWMEVVRKTLLNSIYHIFFTQFTFILMKATKRIDPSSHLPTASTQLPPPREKIGVKMVEEGKAESEGREKERVN